MPVSVITDIVTWAELILQAGITTVELGVLNYLVFFDGWLDMLRKISFFLDGLIIKYVDKFYSYFDKLLNGRIFHPDVVDKVMGNVYLFVAVFVLFKLMMLLIKYVVNPEMVSDEKIGAASLVKRVIIGMCIMLFLPTIFNIGFRIQSAVLSDNLFGQLLLDKSEINRYEQNKNQIGRVLAFNVYQGFWNLDKSQVTDSRIVGDYENAIAAKDPKVFGDINRKSGGDFAIDYFPALSTVVLFYVLYLVIKYCIDVVVRMFKLFLLQMLGPLAISDYMINGDSKEVFRAWIKTTLSVYLMLFIRVFSIWFVAFISILMEKPCTTVDANGVCKDSLLYVVNGQPDFLLRGIITLGLLALLMDLPKMLSGILGFDLEQDASVKGMMGKIGGAAKMLGTGALAAGGAAIGGAIGTMKNGLGAAKDFSIANAKNKAKLNENIAKKDPNYAQKMKDIQDNKDLTSRQKAKQMGALQKDWLKNEKADYKQAKKDYKANKPDLKAKHKTDLQSWKDSGGKKSGLEKPTLQKPQRDTAVRDYQSANSRAARAAGTRTISSISDGAGGVLAGFGSAIPGVRDAIGGIRQHAGPSDAQQYLSGRKDSGTQQGADYSEGEKWENFELGNSTFPGDEISVNDELAESLAGESDDKLLNNSIPDTNGPQINSTPHVEEVLTEFDPEHMDG